MNLLELTKKQVLVISAITVIVGIAGMVSLFAYAAGSPAVQHHYKADAPAVLPPSVDPVSTEPKQDDAQQAPKPKTTTNPPASVNTPQQAPAQAQATIPAPKVFDDSNCQYPGRLTNVNGCDNSDPCDPTTLKDPTLTGACRN